MGKTPNTPEWRAFREAADRHIQNQWDVLEKQVSIVEGKSLLDKVLKNGSR